jgi:hypothetical protein
MNSRISYWCPVDRQVRPPTVGRAPASIPEGREMVTYCRGRDVRITHEGSYRVELFRSPDSRVFGQVRRALLRALEEVPEW